METAKSHNTPLTGEIEFGGKKYENFAELQFALREALARVDVRNAIINALKRATNEELLKECKRRELL